MIGFHGTDIKNFDSIKSTNFVASEGDSEWLGNGVYFFVEGISDPIKNAKDWAIVSSWNNNLKLNEYTKFAVISAEINVLDDYLLDLTTHDGMETFIYFRNKFIEMISKRKLILKNGDFKDGHIINEARYSIRIDVVKSNFYIKFAKERIMNINFRIPK